MEQKRITKIDALPQLQKKIRVAAYARVSCGKDAMLHSLSAQVSYYNKAISEHEGWEFAGVYADEALSGTKDTREEFQILMNACKAGKIDLVLCKSISRFARNTMTMLENVRELKAIGVDVFFEEQNLHTLSAEGEMVLTFLSSFAQEEARSMSENMKWRIKRDFEKGIIWGGGDAYGYRLIGRKYVVVPEQAEVVKRIFKMYLDGCGFQMIANKLDAEGVPTLNAKKWGKSALQNILSNIIYTGALVLQKTYRESYLTKKTKKNNGELSKYYVEDDHEAIIPMDEFMRVQEIRAQRREHFKNETHGLANFTYTGLMKCGKCGAHYKRKNRSGMKVWACSTYEMRGKAECNSKAIREDILDEITMETLGLEEMDKELVRSLVEYIEVFDENKLVYHLKDDSIKTAYWTGKSRREAWTPEMKEKARQRSLERYKKEAN